MHTIHQTIALLQSEGIRGIWVVPNYLLHYFTSSMQTVCQATHRTMAGVSWPNIDHSVLYCSN